MEKPSLMYVRKVSAALPVSDLGEASPQLGLGWRRVHAYGHAWNRLQARLYGRQF